MSLSPPWALSDSNAKPEQPSTAFQGASERRIAWLVQTTPPVEEITAPGKVLGLDVGNIQRLYRKWGPSARSCVRLRLEGDESLHELKVKNAAREFVENPLQRFPPLFSTRPENQDRGKLLRR
ncbi:hypothetical protein EDB83DRAFT_2518685 [Lactarius deliciosus]|nr:hypothetical protein EDB83DRAFT_2518685 [Lactarius deliciosus]